MQWFLGIGFRKLIEFLEYSHNIFLHCHEWDGESDFSCRKARNSLSIYPLMDFEEWVLTCPMFNPKNRYMKVYLISEHNWFDNNVTDNTSVEHLIALLTSQCFQILLTPRIFSVWDYVVGIFARKALLNMDRELSTLSC